MLIYTAMQYHTGYTSKKLDTREAARLTQTLIPLALIYSSLHAIGKGFYGTLPEEAAKYVKGTKEMVADLWCRETLDFIGENPYDIPPEQNTPSL